MLDWRNIHTVLLDLDGTLLDLHYDNFFWQVFVPNRYAQLRGLNDDEALIELQRRYKAVEGTIDWYCVNYWSGELGLNIAELKAELKHMIQVHPFVIDFLEELQRNGKRVLLVSNAHRHSLDIKLTHTKLGVYFEKIISSHDYSTPKETAQFWHCFSREYAIVPEDCLFIDDSLPVLRSARDFGIRHLLAIGRPDSKAPKKDTHEFRCLDGFHQLLPMT